MEGFRQGLRVNRRGFGMAVIGRKLLIPTPEAYSNVPDTSIIIKGLKKE